MSSTERIGSSRSVQTCESVMTTIFGTNTQVRVISYLATHNDEPHMQIEISEEVDASQPMISRATRPLRESGLVVETDGGLTLADGETSKYLVKMVESMGDELEAGPN